MLGLAQASADPTDSPEIGPPPIAHFEAGDPIQYDSSQDKLRGMSMLEDAEGLNAALLINLETRRKRRESSQRADSTVIESAPSEVKNQGGQDGRTSREHSLKPGAKRKSNARDEDGQAETQAACEDDTRNHDVPRADDTQHTKPTGKEKHARQRSSEDPVRNKERSRERPKVDISSALVGRNVLAPSKPTSYITELAHS